MPKPRRKRSHRKSQKLPSQAIGAMIVGGVLVIGLLGYFIVRSQFRKEREIPTTISTGKPSIVTPDPEPTALPPTKRSDQPIPKKYPEFGVDAEAVKLLGKEEIIEGRRLRIPEGWVVDTTTPNERGSTTVWKDPKSTRADKTSPNLQVIVVNMSQEEMNQISWKPEDMLDRRIAGELNGLVQTERTPNERGYINGVFGVRARWKGKNPKTQRVAHGIVYLFFDKLQLIVMISGLTEPGHEEAIRLAEAAMLTIRRQ